jgi:hypothetical protein
MFYLATKKDYTAKFPEIKRIIPMVDLVAQTAFIKTS